jgi:hypothetical protein
MNIGPRRTGIGELGPDERSTRRFGCRRRSERHSQAAVFLSFCWFLDHSDESIAGDKENDDKRQNNDNDDNDDLGTKNQKKTP